MKVAIRERARELGFDDCRFTTAAPPDHAVEFQNWLAHNQHGEMNYLVRNAHKRVNPREVLPGAKSIIVLATSYSEASSIAHRSPDAGAENSKPETRNPKLGLIARYARFKDYHDILADRLKQLTEFVNQLGGENSSQSGPIIKSTGTCPPGAPSPSPPQSGGEGRGEVALREHTRSLWYVDTGPLLERDLAQRAGLGFVGKHTNLISRRLGNWIFLAEIITTLELESDAPEKNRCGTCTRCISACPTAAITGPFQLDARRCISYLTIELKGAIPVEFRSAIGNRIYGCDDCLAACPWNKFAREGTLMKAHARTDLGAPELLELLALDAAGFKSRFAGTPILRAKRRGLLRNVCVALGNIGDATALPALRKAAEDLEPLIAEHARWAIEQIESRKIAARASRP